MDRLRRVGVLVSLNTDDPSLLGMTLTGEYALCGAHFGWNDAVLRDMASTSITACFANDDVQRDLRRALAAW